MSVDRIIPSALDDDELHRRNGEYVSADAYDDAIARIAEIEAALRMIIDVPDAPGMEYAIDVREAIDAAKKILNKDG